MAQDLDSRKKTILKAIIKTYLETGEPVGSRTISKYTDLNLSSATIRNEMADLEEMGLIVQPHTSAGRIPTDRGYRIYVDELMREKEEREREQTQMRDFLIERVDRVELLLAQLAKILASNTNYATMIAGPKLNRNKLKYIQISKVDVNRILTVVVVEGNIIKNTIMEVDGANLSEEAVLNLNILLNSTLNGLSMEEINLGVISRLKEEAGEFAHIVDAVLGAVSDAIGTEALPQQSVYTSGATNIFKYPELSDGAKASEIISAFEEKDRLAAAISSTIDPENEHGIQVYIGSESPIENMQDCSLVTANYELGDGLHGTIGIIGPKRMDYEKVVSTLKQLTDQLNEIYHKS